VEDTHFDAIIIGSGFGGSVMAYRLAQAGLRVCLLERGKPYPPNSFPRAPFKLQKNFWDPSAGHYGLFNVWSFRGSGALISSGLGGGSLIYANVIIRKDENWFKDEVDGGGYRLWPVTRAGLDPHYDEVAKMLNVQRYPIGIAGYRTAPKTLAMIEAAEKLKDQVGDLEHKWLPLDLAVSFRTSPVLDPANPDNERNPPVEGEPLDQGKDNYHRKTRVTCVQCGECDLGCNTGSKNTLDYTYITEAQRHNADIRPLCEVKSFEPLADGQGYSVTYVKHEPDKWDGQPVKEIRQKHPELFPETTITTKRLIISAGAFGSPYLLFKNKKFFPGLSSRLGARFSVNGDLLSFIVNSKTVKEGKSLARVIDPSFGPVITSAIRIADKLDGGKNRGRGFYVEDGGHPSFMGWAAELAGFAGILRRSAQFAKMFLKYRIGILRNTQLDHDIAELIGDCSMSKSSFPLLSMGRDTPNGNLSFENDLLDCDWNLAKSQEYFDLVRRVVKGIARSLNAKYLDNPSYQYLQQVLTAHPLGGCSMGETIHDGVVNSFGEVFNYPGLYVVDGSIMPGPVGPNPSMTIAAIADRAAGHIIQQHEGVPL
jgi:cholesterol oxidase